MKYIVVTMPDEKGDDQEAIFVFPRSLNHDFMMEGIQAVRRGTPQNWKRNWDARAIAAGFVTHGKCHGHSETLGLDSRGAVDDILLTTHGVGQ